MQKFIPLSNVKLMQKFIPISNVKLMQKFILISNVKLMQKFVLWYGANLPYMNVLCMSWQISLIFLFYEWWNKN